MRLVWILVDGRQLVVHVLADEDIGDLEGSGEVSSNHWIFSPEPDDVFLHVADICLDKFFKSLNLTLLSRVCFVLLVGGRHDLFSPLNQHQ